MALAATKVTFFFQQGGYGWSESQYLGVDPGDYKAVKAKADKLLIKRLACCGAQTTSAFQRIQQASGKRLGKTFPLSPSGGNSSMTSDSPSNSILVRRWSAPPVIKTSAMFMRGVWDDAIVQGGDVPETTAWYTQAFGPYQKLFVTDGWGWLGNDPTAQKRETIISIVAGADGRLTITTINPVFAAGDVGTKVKIAVSGSTGAKTANGVWIVDVLSLTSVRTVKPILINPYDVGSGKLLYNVLRFYAADSIDVDRCVERHAGRPSYHSRGRAKKARPVY